MDAIKRFWQASLLNKAIVIGLAGLICCYPLAIAGDPDARNQAAALAPVESPGPTRTPRPTSAPEPSATLRPTATPRPTLAPLPTALGARPVGSNCPASHPIKGNIRDREPNKGERIYHLPGGASYDRTDPERCFATAAEAEEAGYRPADR